VRGLADATEVVGCGGNVVPILLVGMRVGACAVEFGMGVPERRTMNGDDLMYEFWCKGAFC